MCTVYGACVSSYQAYITASPSQTTSSSFHVPVACLCPEAATDHFVDVSFIFLVSFSTMIFSISCLCIGPPKNGSVGLYSYLFSFSIYATFNAFTIANIVALFLFVCSSITTPDGKNIYTVFGFCVIPVIYISNVILFLSSAILIFSRTTFKPSWSVMSLSSHISLTFLLFIASCNFVIVSVSFN